MFSYLLAIALVAAASAESIRPRHTLPYGRIVGGQDAEIENYPYQISLQYYGSHICGGSIVSEYYVVTAGHCIMEASAMSVRVGSTYHREGGSVHDVEAVTRHENFEYNSAGVPLNDVAVVKVKQPFVFNKTVQPIKLYASGEEASPGAQSVITGWGSIYSGGSSVSHLQTVTIPIISKNLCNEAYDDGHYGGLPEGQICAAYYGVGGKDACQGDSGGPLAIDGRLAGIVSWGSGCAKPYYPGAYTEVAHYREWINEHAKLA